MSFNQARSWGFALQRLPRRRSPQPLGSAAPPVIGSPRLPTPRVRRRQARSPARPDLGPDMASLQGVTPCVASGTRRWISPLATRPLALLGFSLSEALSSRASDLVEVSLAMRSFRRTLALACYAWPPFARGPPSPEGARLAIRSRLRPSFPALRKKPPVWVLIPVLQSFKEHGNRLASSEVAGLCEV